MFLLFIDILLSTEPFHHSFPSYQDENELPKSVVLIFKRASIDGGGDDDAAAVSTNKASDSTIMTVHIKKDDTIQSLSKRIRVGVIIYMIMHIICMIFYMYVCLCVCIYVFYLGDKIINLIMTLSNFIII